MDESSIPPLKVVVLADLNVDPPEIDDDDSVPVSAPDINRLAIDDNNQDKSTLTKKDTDAVEVEGSKRVNKFGKFRSRISKADCSGDYGPEADADHQGPGVSSSREEKVSSLKTGLGHVARKMQKNAHAHFILGLMYQRVGQPQKAVAAYETAEEILLRSDSEIDRPEFLSMVQIHHAQCLLLETGWDRSDKELEGEELEEILNKLKESMQSDVRQATLWNTVGLTHLTTGRLQNAIAIFSSLLSIVPDNYDCLGNLGIAYLQCGNVEQSEKCFQELILKDQNHPAALINYAALLLCKYGAIVAGAGANAGEGSSGNQIKGITVAKDCLLTALKADPKAAHLWANLANAYHIIGDHRSSGKCLEKVAKLEPNCMSMRYSIAVHRIKDAERSQDPCEQLTWAGNEMASIIRDGDVSVIEHPIAWAGLAMAQKAQHEISAAFQIEQSELMEAEVRAVHSLKQANIFTSVGSKISILQHLGVLMRSGAFVLVYVHEAISEDPEDAVQWHQLGLHSLCTRQFKSSQRYLKSAIARFKDCSYAWSNLGVSLQLSEEPLQAEEVYKRALELAPENCAHVIFSNLGNLYRQQKQYERAKPMFSKSLELQPGYAPAFNNLGLVFVAEGQWEEARYCFDKALQVDPLLDAAKSNVIKAAAMSKFCSS